MGKKGDGMKFCFDLLMTWNPASPLSGWGRGWRSSAQCGEQMVAVEGAWAGMKMERSGRRQGVTSTEPGCVQGLCADDFISAAVEETRKPRLRSANVFCKKPDGK